MQRVPLRGQRIIASAKALERFSGICPAWPVDNHDAGSSELVDDRLLCSPFFTLVSQPFQKVEETLTLLCSHDELLDSFGVVIELCNGRGARRSPSA
ncbi:MAG TPA: hypothetical protein VI074_02090 [Propionibacteriaceae bacterium]|jgi:hypothetical protein